MQTAVIYARYSSEKQTEQSIEGQLRVCTEYAQKHDILILDTYIDRAMTGTNDNRPEFQRMIKDSAKRQFQVVLVYKLDRFSRDKYATAVNKHTLKNNGVKVLSAMENIPDTPEGIILESLLEGMNQYYSAELSQKVKRGMRETRRKGHYQGGGLLFGYKVIDHKIVIDEERAEQVLYMFQQYANGVFVKDIIKALTNRGVLYKGRPFARNTVYDILRNSKYSGVYVRGEEVIDNMYPQIIPTELFNKVREIVNKNKFGKRSVKTVYMLRNKVFCGHCGRPVSADTGTARNGEVIHYYKCIGRKVDHNGCQLSPIKKEDLEKLVIDSTIEELTNPRILEYAVQYLMRIQEEHLSENAILKVLTKQKTAVDRALQNLVNAIENGIISNTTNKRLHELETQQEELERQILIERSKCAVKLPEKAIRGFFVQILKEEPQAIINHLIKKVVLFDDHIEIYYNSPIRISPDDSQGFSFYKKSYGMGKQSIIVFLKL